MRILRIAVVVSLAVAALGQQTSAQSLSFSLFERYVESLRVQTAIPGMSAAVVQDGRIVWEKGFGLEDVDRTVAATPRTPYAVADLSQTLASTLLLGQCVDRGTLEMTDRVRRWVSQYPDADATVGQLLAHTTSSGFKYDATRFADLTGVLDQCTSARYPVRLVAEIFDRLGMTDSVPGQDLEDPSSPNRRFHPADRLAQYSGVLKRLAVPYRVDSKGKPVRSENPAKTLTASTGVISTVRDLARFDAALSEGALVDSGTLAAAWSRSGSRPTGFGWFVQSHGSSSEKVVWHFGLEMDSYSSLILKLPGRDLTLILLANSDGLSARYSLQSGDVTASPFASTFLRIFVP